MSKIDIEIINMVKNNYIILSEIKSLNNLKNKKKVLIN